MATQKPVLGQDPSKVRAPALGEKDCLDTIRPEEETLAQMFPQISPLGTTPAQV